MTVMKITWILVAAAAAFGCSGPSDPMLSEDVGLVSEAGPFRVEARFDPDPPKRGTNRVELRVTDPSGAPVESVSVGGAAVMPAMGAMPEMRAGGVARALGDGRFGLELELSMAGAWPLALTVTGAGGETGVIAFDYKTGVPVKLAGTRARQPGESVTERGAVDIDTAQRQRIGVKTAVVRKMPAVAPLRALGRVVYDETALTDVTLKFQGWIGEVLVDSTGAPVSAGEPLFTVYAPELLSAQEEFLESARRGSTLLPSARRRLLLWNLTDGQIDALAARGTPLTYVPIHSPASGVVIEKTVVDGSSVVAGQHLYRIADLSTVWIDADIYEADLALVKPGDTATITLSYVPGETFDGVVDYVYPYLDTATRTGRARVVVDNEAGLLKPGMYADLQLRAPLGDQIVVPDSAVLRSGEKDIVFVDLGDGRLAPRRVELGQRTAGGYVVRAGIAAGDTVVTSGNFLVAAESRLQAGLDSW